MLSSFEDSYQLSIRSKHTSSDEGTSFSLTIIASWVATISLFLACGHITFTSTPSPFPSHVAYSAFIAFTPVVHALDLHLRLLYHDQETSGLFFTISEAVRETFSVVASVSFMRIIDSLLKHHYVKTGVRDLIRVLLNKEFEIHYPFHVIKPTKYKARKVHLILMRLVYYQTLVTTTIFYGGRVWFESTSRLSEIVGHCFQVIYVITSSASVSAVYVYAQGVDGEIPRYRMAHKIKMFELLMVLLWFQGAGVELLHWAHSYCVMTTLYGFSVRDILDQGA